MRLLSRWALVLPLLALVALGLTGDVNSEGPGAALATVLTLTVLTLVFPSFTTTQSGSQFSGGQLAFAASSSWRPSSSSRPFPDGYRRLVPGGTRRTRGRRHVAFSGCRSSCE